MKYILTTILSILILGNINAEERKMNNLKHWRFQKGDFYQAQNVDYNDAQWERIKVPHTYSMDAITEVGYYKGPAWYRTEVPGNTYQKGERIFIRFEGVGHKAKLYLNGQYISEHKGSYSAFCYELTKHWDFSIINTIALRTDNAADYTVLPVNTALFNIYGGIYRPVAMFSTPACHITPTHYASPGVFVESKVIEKGKTIVEVRTHIHNGSSKADVPLSLLIKDANGTTVASFDKICKVKAGASIIDSSHLEIPNPKLWNGMENPYLYTIEATLGSGDLVKQSFGIRSIEVDANKGFLLNDKRLQLRGVCRHQEWKHEGPALASEHHKTDMDIMEEMGVNAIRLAHYQQAEDMYRMADERGMVVWAEIPFVNDWSGRERQNAKVQMTELILQNYNHPSICFWGLWNEVRAWNNEKNPVETTQELDSLCKVLDPSRPTTSASDRPIDAPMSLISDLQAWNKYYGWYYGEYKDLGQWLEDTHAAHPEIKIGVSEYGAGGNIAHQDASRNEKPSGNYFPEQDHTLCHEISWAAIKDKEYVWGSFVWNMFDFSVNCWNRGSIPNTNHKGLVTFDRQVKKDAFYFYKANWSKEPVLYIAETRNNKRNQAKTEVKVYTNLSGKVSLEVNGKKVATQKLKNDLHIIRFENIMLSKGQNTIIVRAEYNEELMSHNTTWELQ